MAIWWDSPVPPDAQTAFMREVPFGSNLGLTNLFGRQTSDDNTVDFSEIVRTNRTARYRTWDGRIHVSQRDSGSDKRVKILPLSTSLNESEFERVMRMINRTRGTNMSLVENAIYNDSERLTGEVQNRVEMAWGDVVSDGVLTIAEGGLGGTATQADFGVPSGQKVTVSTPWSTTGSSTVFADLTTAVNTYITNNGFPPGSILTSAATNGYMRQSSELVDQIYGTADTRTRVKQQELRDFLRDELYGIELRDPYDSSFDVDGTTTRSLAANKVLLLPPNVNDLGYTVWGTTATSEELVNSSQSELSFEEAPGIVGVVEKVGPPYRSFTFVDAVAMPILANAKLLSILTV